MKVRVRCALAVAILVCLAASARAQSDAPVPIEIEGVAVPAPVRAWSADEQREFRQWLTAERDWREWMADNRNVVTHNWMGMGARDWLGRPSDRPTRPVAPAWLPAFCDALTPAQLEDHVPCQQYESIKTYDWASETVRQQFVVARSDKPEHSHFDLKEHWGFGLGYDNRMVHGSFGMQLTVAEWGRWNYGTLGASLGFMHHPPAEANQPHASNSDVSLFLTLASASYRIKYLESFGMYWYVDFAQVYDINHNMTGSQFGFSLSRK